LSNGFGDTALGEYFPCIWAPRRMSTSACLENSVNGWWQLVLQARCQIG